MSLTPIFDEVCDDLGYVPIQTHDTIRAPWGTTYAFDRSLLHYWWTPPTDVRSIFGTVA